jgi:hypothetical protein
MMQRAAEPVLHRVAMQARHAVTQLHRNTMHWGHAQWDTSPQIPITRPLRLFADADREFGGSNQLLSSSQRPLWRGSFRWWGRTPTAVLFYDKLLLIEPKASPREIALSRCLVWIGRERLFALWDWATLPRITSCRTLLLGRQIICL